MLEKESHVVLRCFVLEAFDAVLSNTSASLNRTKMIVILQCSKCCICINVQYVHVSGKYSCLITPLSSVQKSG